MHNKKQKLDLAFHGGSFKNSLAEALSARCMSWLGAAKHAAAAAASTQDGQEDPHIREERAPTLTALVSFLIGIWGRGYN